jgi:hypothetical protein
MNQTNDSNTCKKIEEKLKIVTIIKEGKSTTYYYKQYNPGVLHRLSGPAIESKYEKRYFIDGIEISEEKFNEIVKIVDT